MTQIARTIIGIVAILMVLSSCFWFGIGLSEETIAEFQPLIWVVTGSGFLIGGLLILNSLGNENLKEAIDNQNKILLEINHSILSSTKTNVEIARRQYQVEKRETGSLLQRNRQE